MPFPNLAQILHGFRHPYALNPPMQGDIEYNIVWLPPLVVLASLIMSSKSPTSHATCLTATNLVCLTLLTALLFLKGFVRVSPLHMVPGIVPALILLACLVARLPAMGRPLALPYRSLLLGRCPVFLRRRIMTTSYFVRPAFGSGGTGPPLRRSLSSARRPISCPLPLPSAGRTAGHPISSVPDQPQEPIFVGVPRYDILHLSDIEIYFFSKREAGTRWYDLHPGVETTAPIQTEMIRELEHNRVRFIVRDNLIYPDEPNQSRLAVESSAGSLHQRQLCTATCIW